MLWVAIFPQTIKKLFNFQNKARLNVLGSPSKPDLISVKRDIFLTCFPTAVQDWKSAFKAFTKILPGTPIEGTPLSPWKKLSPLLRTVHTKWLAIWCLISQIWACKGTFSHSENFLKIPVLDLMEWKFIQLSLLEELGYMNYGKTESIETIIQILLSKLLPSCLLSFLLGLECTEFKEIYQCH